MRSGALRQLGAILYRLYVAALMLLFGFAFLGDLSGEHAHPLVISTRASAAAGAVLVGVVFAATLVGRVAVALRPSSADVQLALLSPVDRSATLARPIGFTATASIFVAGGAALVLMLVASPQFAGLSVGIQFAYVAFASGMGLITYGGHLVVAQHRRHAFAVVGTALAGASVFDVAKESSWSPVTAALRGVRGLAPVPAVAGALAIGVVAAWRALVDAEKIELERISRGGDLADHAAVALSLHVLPTFLNLHR